MNLLVLMYHRARAERHGNPPELLDAHLAHVAKAYCTVLPGDALERDRLNVCLSFDDGYFDFHAIVFPLLKKYQLRALLAIPPFYVSAETLAAREARLDVASNDAFADPSRGGFCTWIELAEMVTSGHVTVAAHGYSHRRLDESADLPAEIDQPHAILSSRLAQPVDSFVFPFGRFSSDALRHAKRRYRHVFRIGGALNRSWQDRVLYRVDADQMTDPWTLFSPRRLVAYRARNLWNRVRRR